MEQRFCTRCGEPAGAGNLFCGHCGAKFGSAEGQATNDSQARNEGLSTLQILAIAVVIVAVGLGGYLIFRPKTAPGPNASGQLATSVVATETPTLAITLAPPTPAATQGVLLTMSGNGIKNSGPFTASGDSVQVAYTFDCAAFGGKGNFIAHLVGSDGIPAAIANELAASGKDSTTVYLLGTSGPYHVEVNSECSWSLTVTGSH
jgi:hypothetical protein